MIPAWAGEYVGIPWTPRGRSTDGTDCWGLCWLVLRERGDIDLDPFDADPDDAAALFGEQKALPAWRQIKPGFERRFDLALMSIPCCDGKRWDDAHIGIVIAPGHLLHVLAGTDSVCAPYRGKRLGRRITEFWRHKSLTG